MTVGDSQGWDSRAFEARYPGTCMAECEDPIEPGQRVMYVGTVVVHEACATSAPAGSPDPENTKFKGTTLEEMGF